MFARWRTDAPGDTRRRKDAPGDAPGPIRHAASASRPPLEPAARRALGVGLTLALATQLAPVLQMLIQYMVVLVHELGHAAAGWLFGFPSVPAFDFMYGGGVTTHAERSKTLVLLVLGAGGFGLWSLREHPRLMRFGLATCGLYLLAIGVGADEALILAMGHGAELGFAGLFFYRALTGSGCHLEAERPLYAWLAGHIVLFDLRFAWGLATSAAERARYGAAKGGGHWMDFSRLADEVLHVPLEGLAVAFGLLCLVPLPLAWRLARRPRGSEELPAVADEPIPSLG